MRANKAEQGRDSAPDHAPSSAELSDKDVIGQIRKHIAPPEGRHKKFDLWLGGKSHAHFVIDQGIDVAVTDLQTFACLLFMRPLFWKNKSLCNPDCPAPYFLQQRKGQQFCTHKCAVLSIDNAKAQKIAKEVGQAVKRWRAEAAKAGINDAEIDRMASAFEHDGLKNAVKGKYVRRKMKDKYLERALLIVARFRTSPSNCCWLASRRESFSFAWPSECADH